MVTAFAQTIIDAARPWLKLAIDHLGVLDITVDKDIAPYVEATAELVSLAKVTVKLTNLPSFSTFPIRSKICGRMCKLS